MNPSDIRVTLPPGNRDRGGWTTFDIGRMDEGKMADLVRLAWRQVAPGTLSAGERE